MDEPTLIRCWVEKGLRSGVGFSMKLKLEGSFYVGICQIESPATGEIVSLRSGEIDRKKPYQEFRVSKTAILNLVNQLAAQGVPVIPPPISGGFDGHHEHLELATHSSRVHFAWFVIGPTQWNPLIDFRDAIVRLAPIQP